MKVTKIIYQIYVDGESSSVGLRPNILIWHCFDIVVRVDIIELDQMTVLELL